MPAEVYALFKGRAEDGKKEHAAWGAREAELTKAGGDKADLYAKLMKRAVPADLFEELVKVAPAKDAATRAQASVIEQRLAALVPSLMGGSADLNPSTKTYIDGSGALAKGDFGGRNVHFGIREHAMGSFVNGVAAGDAWIPFGSTFLIFSDYMRPAIRLAALSHLHAIFVFTHDSVYLGEDGPTHQPIEHHWTLRLIPNCDYVRPCDALECAAAWTHAVTRTDGPTVLALSRQTLANVPRADGFDERDMLKGAYVLADAKDPTFAIIATGSEVEVAIGAKKILDAQGERVRVVSAPCWNAFERQDDAYKERVLPKGLPRAAIEIGVTEPWKASSASTAPSSASIIPATCARQGHPEGARLHAGGRSRRRCAPGARRAPRRADSPAACEDEAWISASSTSPSSTAALRRSRTAPR